MYEVEVWGIAVDPFNQSPIVVLKNKQNPKEVLPIWIGHPEASGIMMVLNNVEFERPLTYELINNLLETVGAVVEKVEISDIKDGTYYATIYVKTPAGEIKEVDARPSDAINIALRTGAPIYVAEHVMNQSKVVVEEIPPQKDGEEQKLPNVGDIVSPPQVEAEEETTTTDEELKRWIENLKPEDFQKFGSSEGN
ncbi:MAG TPA: bifunctional nuclease family protein [Aquificales bacterium]|nr:bifunctional nuclease family protein [Aquificales bacterium]